MIRVDLKKIIGNPVTYFCVLVMVISLYFGTSIELHICRNVHVLPFFGFAYMGCASLFVSSVCIIPAVLYLVQEINTPYEYYVLSKISMIKNAFSKVFVTLFSGIYIAFVSSTIFVLFLVAIGKKLIVPPEEILLAGEFYHYQGTMYGNLIANGHSIMALILIIFINSLATIPWSMVILIISIIFKNKYLIIIVPTIIDNVLRMICFSRSELFDFNPATLIVTNCAAFNYPYGGYLYEAKKYAFIIIVLGSVFLYGYLRRERNCKC